MATIIDQLFGLHNKEDPLGTESRRTTDDNLRALAASMVSSFPELKDTACVKSGAELNDTVEAGENEVITGSWTFTAPTEHQSYMTYSTNAKPVRYTSSGNQTCEKTGAGDLRFDVVDTGQELRARIGGNDRLRVSNTTVRADARFNIQGVDQPIDVQVARYIVPSGTGICTQETGSPGAQGWSCEKVSSTLYRVTHNYATTNYVAQVTWSQERPVSVKSLIANSFEIGIGTSAAGEQFHVTVTRA